MSPASSTTHRAAARFTAAQGLAPLVPGDLLAWGTSRDLHHIAIYLGAGKMVEAKESGTRLMVSDVRLNGDYFGAVRVNTGQVTGHIHQTWGTGVWTKAAPALSAARVYAFPYSTTIRVQCQKHAEEVTAEGYTNDAWSYLPDYKAWVTNIYIQGRPGWTGFPNAGRGTRRRGDALLNTTRMTNGWTAARSSRPSRRPGGLRHRVDIALHDLVQVRRFGRHPMGPCVLRGDRYLTAGFEQHEAVRVREADFKVQDGVTTVRIPDLDGRVRVLHACAAHEQGGAVLEGRGLATGRRHGGRGLRTATVTAGRTAGRATGPSAAARLRTPWSCPESPQPVSASTIITDTTVSLSPRPRMYMPAF
ncbi:hypothetical protein SHKM778_36400 [Streptomyces sp. KM77-8]|uniref:NlpC/P60 domain-containing protein n=1 Tax=Streptomyces haneummycinicus TaxID=3074435 RepID=A0AAT9HIV0_9ACTN